MATSRNWCPIANSCLRSHACPSPITRRCTTPQLATFCRQFDSRHQRGNLSSTRSRQAKFGLPQRLQRRRRQVCGAMTGTMPTISIDTMVAARAAAAAVAMSAQCRDRLNGAALSHCLQTISVDGRPSRCHGGEHTTVPLRCTCNSRAMFVEFA